MKAGLRCRDKDGTIIFDTTSKISRVLGEFTTGRSEGRLTDDQLSNGKAFVVFIGYAEFEQNAYFPHVWFEGNAICWRFFGEWWSRRNSVKFLYGVNTV